MLDSLLSFLRGKKLKVYVIIDEYDNFANTILSTAGQEEYWNITHGEGFYRVFFNVLKGATGGAYSPIAKLFISGVSPITMDDLTSGFNIASNITMHPDINEMVGFTVKEVEAMINYYQQTGKIKHTTAELLEIMSYWYNGYRFTYQAATTLFNSTQVLYFLEQYLTYSALPQNMVDRNLLIDYQKIRELIIIDQKGTYQTNGNFSILQEIIQNGSIESTINDSFPAKELTNPGNFISLFFCLLKRICG